MNNLSEMVKLTHLTAAELMEPSRVKLIRYQDEFDLGDSWLAQGEFVEVDSSFDPPARNVVNRYCLWIKLGMGSLLAHEINGQWQPVWLLATNAQRLIG